MVNRRPFIRFEMHGVADVAAALMALGSDRLIRATLKRALLEAAQPMVSTARSRAPRGTDGPPSIADGIAVSATLSRRQRGLAGARVVEGVNVARVYVGARPRGPAVLAEFGTGPRRTKSGANRGIMPAHPFMRPAWESHKEQILRDFSSALGRQVEASAKRLARRQARGTASRSGR